MQLSEIAHVAMRRIQAGGRNQQCRIISVAITNRGAVLGDSTRCCHEDKTGGRNQQYRAISVGTTNRGAVLGTTHVPVTRKPVLDDTSCDNEE